MSPKDPNQPRQGNPSDRPSERGGSGSQQPGGAKPQQQGRESGGSREGRDAPRTERGQSEREQPDTGSKQSPGIRPTSPRYGDTEPGDPRRLEAEATRRGRQESAGTERADSEKDDDV